MQNGNILIIDYPLIIMLEVVMQRTDNFLALGRH